MSTISSWVAKYQRGLECEISHSNKNKKLSSSQVSFASRLKLDKARTHFGGQWGEGGSWDCLLEAVARTIINWISHRSRSQDLRPAQYYSAGRTNLVGLRCTLGESHDNLEKTISAISPTLDQTNRVHTKTRTQFQDVSMTFNTIPWPRKLRTGKNNELFWPNILMIP